MGYEFVIQPIVYVIELAFSASLRLVGSPGIAIICVSVAVSLLCAPLYAMADRLQRRERERQAAMADWVARIKQNFRGDERYMMLATYYREQGYRQVYALASSVSLLLQIPFFIAAYTYLSNLSLLEGRPFLFVDNLARPDAALVVGGVPINVLPIAMTALNVISTLVYTKGQPMRDKVQALGLAAVFFVLLYASPAGLVLYWTCNQVFSLVRNVVQARAAARGGVGERAEGPVASGLPMAGAKEGDGLAAVVATGPAQTRGAGSGALPAGGARVASAQATGTPSADPTAAGASPDRSLPTFFLAGGLMVALLGLLVPSALIAASPREFMDVTYFVNPLSHLVSSVVVFGGLLLLWAGVYFLLAAPRGRRVAAQVFGALALALVMDYLVFGGGMGIVGANLVFDYEPQVELGQAVANLLAIAGVVGAFVFLWRARRPIVDAVLTVALMAVVGLALPNVATIWQAADDVQQEMAEIAAAAETPDRSLVPAASSSATKLPEFDEQGNPLPVFTLSREGTNVVIVFLDRAIGMYVPYLMAERPQLREAFDGFVYYPNTTSFGQGTMLGAPALYGGYDYTPTHINERVDELLVDKHEESLKVLPTVFSKAGFGVTVVDPPFVGYEYDRYDYALYDDLDGVSAYHLDGTYVDHYFGEEIRQVGERSFRRNLLYYSLLKTLPVACRPAVYDGGTYWSTIMNHAMNQDFLGAFTVLESLPALTQVDEGGSDNFVLLQNKTAHEPELLQMPDYLPAFEVDNASLFDASSYVQDGRVMSLEREDQIEHYHANMAAFIQLGNWFDWMREQGVYDNTRIIVVSDHGRGIGQFSDLILSGGDEIECMSALLMVKDFGASGFEISRDFMTNGDASTIALAGVVDSPENPYTGHPISSREKEEGAQLVSFLYDVWNAPDYREERTFDMTAGRSYLVSDDIYDPDNWRLVELQ